MQMLSPHPEAEGPNLALARSAVVEAITDNPRAVDWSAVAFALVSASVRDFEEQESRR